MIDSERYPLLAKLDTPANLRQLTDADLPAVAQELRA